MESWGPARCWIRRALQGPISALASYPADNRLPGLLHCRPGAPEPPAAQAGLCLQPPAPVLTAPAGRQALSAGPTPDATPAHIMDPTPRSVFGLGGPTDSSECSDWGGACNQALPSAANSKQVNALLRRAATPEDLLAVAYMHWQLMDSINISFTLNRLGKMADDAGSAASFWQRWGDTTFSWLLESLHGAAQSRDFNAQCTVLSFSALAKLQCGTPELAAALLQPLMRCLASFKDRPAPWALAQLLWALAKDFTSCRTVFLEAKPWLLPSLWEYTALFDAQALSVLFWALGEISSCTSPHEFNLALEAPNLLHYLGEAVVRQACGLGFQGISNIVHASGKMQPPFRHPAMLEALSAAMLHRPQGSLNGDRLTPQAIGSIALGLGNVKYIPECLPTAEGYVGLLDYLGSSLCGMLHLARPQEVANYLSGLAKLDYAPPGPVLCCILGHLAQPHGSLVLDRFSCQELSNLVGALGRFLGCCGSRYKQEPLPEDLLCRFWARFDSVFLACLSSNALTAQQAANMALALSRLPVACHAAAPSSATLSALQQHAQQCLSQFNGQSLSNLVRFFANRGVAPSSTLLSAIGDHAVGLMASGCGLQSVSYLVWALGKLQLPHEAFLLAYMPHVHAMLEAQHWGQQPAAHPADAARLAWGTAALAAERLLPTAAVVKVPHFWEVLLGSVDYMLRCAQLGAAALFKSEELHMLRDAHCMLADAVPTSVFRIPQALNAPSC